MRTADIIRAHRTGRDRVVICGARRRDEAVRLGGVRKPGYSQGGDPQ
jgi:hypothetical protein